MKERAHEYHVVVVREDDGELVFGVTPPDETLDMIVAYGVIACWQFVHCFAPCDESVVVVYYGLSSIVPKGENLEEINRRAVKAVESHRR